MISGESPEGKVVEESGKPVLIPRKSSAMAKTAAGAGFGGILLTLLLSFGPGLMDRMGVDKATQKQILDTAELVQRLIAENKQLKADVAEAKEKADQPKVIVAAAGPTLAEPPPPVEIKPRELTPAEIAALIQQWKPIVDIIRDLLVDLKPKPDPKPPAPVPTPVPVPVPTPQPQPIPPNPTPIPAPTPGSLRIALTAENMTEITSPTVNAGKLILVRLTGSAGGSSLVLLPHGPAQTSKVDANTWAVVLELGSEVDCIGTEFGTQKQVTLRITCNRGPIPPPVPTPIDPVDPPAPKPVSNDLKVILIYESMQGHSAAQDAVLNSTRLMSTLDSRCSKGSDGRANWRKWDKDLTVDASSAMGKIFIEAKTKMLLHNQKVIIDGKGDKIDFPVVAVACGDDSTVYPIPSNASDEQVIAVLNCGAK